MCKKTIYKYFCNKEILIEESTALIHKEVHEIIDNIIVKIIMQLKKIWNTQNVQSVSVLWQLPDLPIKKHYSEIYERYWQKKLGNAAPHF
jgi:hypothetical protein